MKPAKQIQEAGPMRVFFYKGGSSHTVAAAMPKSKNRKPMFNATFSAKSKSRPALKPKPAPKVKRPAKAAAKLPEDFGTELRTARGSRTQKQAAEFLGVPLKAIKNWEQRVNVPNKFTRDAVLGKLRG